MQLQYTYNLIRMYWKLANSNYINEQTGTVLFLYNEMQADIHKGGGFGSVQGDFSMKINVKL